jgi:CxxC motif-containing protein
MKKNLTCIECPLGCSLAIDVENGKVITVSGNKCPKGETYARSEIENPMRVLTSCVLAEGLEVKMVPVRTDKPIPKSRILDAMVEIKKARVTRAVTVGDVITENIFGSGANVIATRQAGRDAV